MPTSASALAIEGKTRYHARTRTMKRRGFLQTAGLALAGGARIATRRAESQERDSTTVQNKDAARPRVLIAAGDRRFADKMASALGETYDVVVADTADAVQRVRGCHAIVYSPEVSGIATDLELLDRHTRQLYALLTVAVAESVKAVVYLSSLRLMTSYPESYAVNEDFRPLPPPARSRSLRIWGNSSAVSSLAKEHCELSCCGWDESLIPPGRRTVRPPSL
jgi:hypothetical protein